MLTHLISVTAYEQSPSIRQNYWKHTNKNGGKTNCFM